MGIGMNDNLQPNDTYADDRDATPTPTQRIVFWVRMSTATILIVATVLTSTLELETLQKGSMIAFLGGAVLVVGLIPAQRIDWQSIITAAGTIIATVGSWLLFSHSTPEALTVLVMVLIAAIALIAMLLFIPSVAWLSSRMSPSPVDQDRRIVVRRLNRGMVKSALSNPPS